MYQAGDVRVETVPDPVIHEPWGTSSSASSKRSERRSAGSLLALLTQLLPFIGYRRTLNGLAAVNEITSKEGKQQ